MRAESITTPGADVHHYEPTVDDLKRVEGADLVVRKAGERYVDVAVRVISPALGIDARRAGV